MAPDPSRRNPFVNVPDDEGTRKGERAELDDAHGELARFPEEDASLHEPHVGDVHGPVIGAKGEVPAREDRAADALVGFKQPPVRPREVQ